MQYPEWIEVRFTVSIYWITSHKSNKKKKKQNPRPKFRKLLFRCASYRFSFEKKPVKVKKERAPKQNVESSNALKYFESEEGLEFLKKPKEPPIKPKPVEVKKVNVVKPTTPEKVVTPINREPTPPSSEPPRVATPPHRLQVESTIDE